MTRIEQLAKLGFTVGIAHGSVEAEQEALRQAREASSPDAIQLRAHAFASEASAYARASGATGDVLVEMTARALSAAVERFTTDAVDMVAFHERALAIAEQEPTVYAVSGHGFQVYVGIDDNTGDGADENALALLAVLEAAAAEAE